MNRIQVFGAGCAKCDRLRKNVEAAVAELRVETKVETVSRIEEIIECGVLVTPALAVDGVVKLVGQVPSVEELKRILR
jgi:small redox-active disulfide protein 2